MLDLFFTVLLSLTAGLAPQEPAGQSGRHFLRPSRTAATPASSPVVEAAATKGKSHAATPADKLHTGRPWPRWHFSRTVDTPAAGTNVVEAAAQKHPAFRRGFWHAPR